MMGRERGGGGRVEGFSVGEGEEVGAKVRVSVPLLPQHSNNHPPPPLPGCRPLRPLLQRCVRGQEIAGETGEAGQAGGLGAEERGEV